MSLQKVVLLGEGGVGKSALTIQFTQNHFIKDYDPTIENSYRKQINLDNESLVLDILDTAGQEEYSVMRAQYIRSGAGFLLVYSVGNRDTFSAMNDFRDQILMVKDKASFPMVLIGNKADLEADQRKVTQEEGEALAKKFGCPFFETSAKTRLNIEECFTQLVRDMKNHEAGKPTTGGMAGKRENRMSKMMKSESFRNMKKNVQKVKCVVM